MTAELLRVLYGLGGLGLFLLGLELLSDGLRRGAGANLQRLLARATATRWRGLIAGTVATALVQASSVTTLTTIGFVNAGLMSFSQSMWVIFGANIGTTTTSWIVSLIGLRVKIDALALPLIGIGVALHYLRKHDRAGAIGWALAGFGLLFLGLDLLKDTFSVYADRLHLPEGNGWQGLALQFVVGVLLTVLLFSSSAATALILTAVHSGLLTDLGAAAMVVGANVGTAITTGLAALGATSNGKRAAAVHVLFNVLTAAVALLTLPGFVAAIDGTRVFLGFEDDPAVRLSLFHTGFNVFGVLLMWPLATPLALWLQTRFRSQEEDLARPHFLDRNVASLPTLALTALGNEVLRLRRLAHSTLRQTLTQGEADATTVAAIRRLAMNIGEFAATIHWPNGSQDEVASVQQWLRTARYAEMSARLAAEAIATWQAAGADAALASGADAHEAQRWPPAFPPAWRNFLAAGTALLDRLNAGPVVPAQPLDEEVAMETAYQALKEALLAAGAQGRMRIPEMDAQLQVASQLHRALQQCLKAYRRAPQSSVAPGPAAT